MSNSKRKVGEGNRTASFDDFQVKRDGDGNLVPRAQDTKMGRVKILPMRYGDVEKWRDKMSDIDEVDAEGVAEQIREFVVEPDFGNYVSKRPDGNSEPHALTGDDIREDFHAMAISELLVAITKGSGIQADIEVGADGTAKIDLESESGN